MASLWAEYMAAVMADNVHTLTYGDCALEEYNDVSVEEIIDWHVEQELELEGNEADNMKNNLMGVTESNIQEIETRFYTENTVTEKIAEGWNFTVQYNADDKSFKITMRK